MIRRRFYDSLSVDVHYSLLLATRSASVTESVCTLDIMPQGLHNEDDRILPLLPPTG